MEQKVIVVGESTLKEVVKTAVREELSEKKKSEGDFEKEKISLTQASHLAGMSIPTFNKRIKEGIFKKHGTGRKIFFLKSEIINALKSCNHG